MSRIRLLHRKPEDAEPVLATLRNAGFEVDYDATTQGFTVAVRRSPPDAFVIDLSKLPSHGREIGVWLRGQKSTRMIPILFLGGEPGKVETVRQKLPDAAYCEPNRLLPALKKCLKDRPVNPVVPQQMMDRYATRTTAQKLGINDGARVAVVDAPRDYAQVIGTLPDGVEFDEENRDGCAVTVWFVEDPETLLAALPKMRKAAAKSRLWVAWPKKAARKDSLLSESLVREMGIEHGLVDYKICSLNNTWSGLCFALKKETTGQSKRAAASQRTGS
jgi:hypothetical protein